MKILKKQLAVAITSVLIVAMAISIVFPAFTVEAATMSTYTFIAPNMNPVGVEQTVLITVWLDKFPPASMFIDNWKPFTLWDFTVTITDPDGNTETRELTSDAIGAQYFQFTPTKVGTYTFVAKFHENNDTIGGNFYKESTSSPLRLEVQQEPVESLPSTPLPTEYWTRPVYGENWEWSSITGDWLTKAYDSGGYATDAYVPYGTAPNTAHVMWTKPFQIGGLVGDGYSNLGYYTGLQYETVFSPAIAIAGRIYYNLPIGTSPTGDGFVCVDLRTGEQLWKAEGTISIGQLLDYESMNQHGVIPYLWYIGSTEYTMYDANSGEKILTLTNVGSGTQVFDENGNILVYLMGGATATRWLALWNSTRCLERGVATTMGFGFGDVNYWRPYSTNIYNWTDGIQWNVTLPNVGANLNIQKIRENIIWARGVIGASGADDVIAVEAGYDATTGTQKWVKNRTGEDALTGSMATSGSCMREGVYTVYKQETKQFYGYDAKTGAKLWVTDPLEDDWSVYIQSCVNIAYGKFYAATYDGKVHAYDLKTGEKVWEYYCGGSGPDTPYTSWPFHWNVVVADGKIFATNGEHSPNSPLWKGEKLHVIDTETGEGVWNMSGWFQSGNPIIADGYYVGLNSYDMQIYCFGKGPSAVTVSAPDAAVTMGTPVVIKGTVTDISPGTEDYTQTARFPNGVPTIADHDMTRWMEYLYEQQPLPTDAEGVEVLIDVLDANGNYRNIGTATSDVSGFYSFEWEPDIPGKYTVIATFAGTESYYASYSETAFTVMEPEITPCPSPTPAPMTDMYIVGSTTGIILAVAVVGLLLFLLLRKR